MLTVYLIAATVIHSQGQPGFIYYSGGSGGVRFTLVPGSAPFPSDSGPRVMRHVKYQQSERGVFSDQDGKRAFLLDRMAFSLDPPVFPPPQQGGPAFKQVRPRADQVTENKVSGEVVIGAQKGPTPGGGIGK